MGKEIGYWKYTLQLYKSTIWKNLERADIISFFVAITFPAIAGYIFQDWRIALILFLCFLPFEIARSTY